MVKVRPGARLRPATALAALLVALVALASLAGGSVYRWCIPMERVMEACCCDHDERPGEEPLVRRVCCEERAVDALPAAQPDRDEPHPAAPAAVAVAEAPLPVPSQLLASRLGRAAAPARAPPARPPPLQRKLALIQVYRC